MLEDHQKFICPECQRCRATLKKPVRERQLRCSICNDAFEHDVKMVPTSDKCVACGITVYEDEYCDRCRPDESSQKSLAGCIG